MLEELIGNIIINLPNFGGMVICIVIQWRIIQRLMDKIDECDCPSDKATTLHN